MPAFLDRLGYHLFDFDRRETRGEIVFFKLFEAVAVGILLYQLWNWAFYIETISDVVMPLGLANYLDVTFMFDSLWPYVNGAAITSLLLAGYLRLHRWAYAGAFGLLLLQYAARYTLGEIPHGTNLTAMVLLGLALSVVVFERSTVQRRFVMGFTYFYTGLAYTLAAWSKLIGTGPHWIDGQHLWIWLHEKAIDTLALQGQHSFNVLQDLAFSHYYLASFFLLAGLLTEFFAWLFWLKPTRLWIGLALLGMHAGIFLMLHITFWMNVVLLLMLTLPWARWMDQSVLQSPVGEPIKRLSARFG